MAKDDIDLIERSDGTLVTSDGEIVDVPQGDERLAHAARQYAYAREQAKEWARRRAVLQAVIIREQATKKAEWDEFITDVRQGSHTVQDVAAIARDAVAVAAELFETQSETLLAIRDLLASAQRFPLEGVPEWAAGVVEEHTESRPNRPWVAVVPKLAEAPRARRIEGGE